MSWQATTWVIEHSRHKGSALLVMMMIANCANESGQDCWPSKERLAHDTRLSQRQLDRIVNQLEASGELAVRRSTGRYPNHYAFPLMLANPVIMSPLNREPTLTNPTSNPVISASNPVIYDANPDITMSPDPSVERSDLERSVLEQSTPVAKSSGRKPPESKPKPEPESDLPFSTEAFVSAFRDYEQHLKEKRHKLTPTARRRLFKRLTGWGETRAVNALVYSMEKNWIGVFEEKGSDGKVRNGDQQVDESVRRYDDRFYPKRYIGKYV